MKELRDIPNQHGFQFIGITHQGNEIDCVVKRNNGSLIHMAYDMFNVPVFKSLKGWRDHEKH